MIMKYKFYPTLLLFFVFCNSALCQLDCQLIDTLLTIPALKDYLAIDEGAHSRVRVFDLKNNFDTCSTYLVDSTGFVDVKVYHGQLPMNINTGLYKDMLVLNYEDSENQRKLVFRLIHHKLKDTFRQLCWFEVWLDREMSIIKYNISEWD